MVELFVTFALLVPALVLLWMGFTGKPWAGLFSGLLLFVFGVLLLGSGFQYGDGVVTNSTSSITTNYWQNLSDLEYSYSCPANDNLQYNGTNWICINGVNTTAASSVRVHVDPQIMNYTKVTTNTVSLSNLSAIKSELTDGASVLFIFLGITVFALSLFVISKNRNSLREQLKAKEEAEED